MPTIKVAAIKINDSTVHSRDREDGSSLLSFGARDMQIIQLFRIFEVVDLSTNFKI